MPGSPDDVPLLSGSDRTSNMFRRRPSRGRPLTGQHLPAGGRGPGVHVDGPINLRASSSHARDSGPDTLASSSLVPTRPHSSSARFKRRGERFNRPALTPDAFSNSSLRTPPSPQLPLDVSTPLPIKKAEPRHACHVSHGAEPLSQIWSEAGVAGACGRVTRRIHCEGPRHASSHDADSQRGLPACPPLRRGHSPIL